MSPSLFTPSKQLAHVSPTPQKTVARIEGSTRKRHGTASRSTDYTIIKKGRRKRIQAVESCPFSRTNRHEHGANMDILKRNIMHFGHFSKTRSVCLARGINQIPDISQLRLENKHSSFDFYLLERAVTPGSSLPSRSSSEAPPPVETWLSLSSTPYLAATVAVSPPPMMTTLPF